MVLIKIEYWQRVQGDSSVALYDTVELDDDTIVPFTHEELSIT